MSSLPSRTRAKRLRRKRTTRIEPRNSGARNDAELSSRVSPQYSADCRVGFAGGAEILGKSSTDFFGDLTHRTGAVAQVQNRAFGFARRRQPGHAVGSRALQLFL